VSVSARILGTDDDLLIPVHSDTDRQT